MLRASTSEAFDQVAIEGDRTGFLALAALVRGGSGTLPLDNTGEPPDARRLSSIVTAESSGDAVEIRCSPDGRELWIGRPPAEADRLAWNLGEYPATLTAGEHVHHEFYPGHPYLTESAIPLVLERRAD